MQECIPASHYQQLPHFISNSPWDAFAVMRQVALNTHQSLSALAGQGGLLLAETGWEKAGQKSVGVTRQYIGQVGKVTHAQVGVFAALSKADKVGLVGARLYLPQAWIQDAKRCGQAGIPLAEQVYRSKPQLAIELLKDLPVDYTWVGGDAIDGNSAVLRQYLLQQGKAFVLDVNQELTVYLTHPQPYLPMPPTGKGRKPTRLTSAQAPLALKQIHQQLAGQDWQLLTYRMGSQGPLARKAALIKVWLWKEASEPPQALHLLISQQVDGSDIKYSLCYQPQTAAELATCLYRQMQRYWVERAFQESKQQLGLHQYQVRSWMAWYHHIALTMMALHFMLQTQVENQPDLPLLSCADIKLILAKTLANKLNEPLGVWQAIEQRHSVRQQDINRRLRRWQT